MRRTWFDRPRSRDRCSRTTRHSAGGRRAKIVSVANTISIWLQPAPPPGRPRSDSQSSPIAALFQPSLPRDSQTARTRLDSPAGRCHNVPHDVRSDTMEREEVVQRVRSSGLIAIFRHTDASLANDTASALLEAGIDVVEVTL